MSTPHPTSSDSHSGAADLGRIQALVQKDMDRVNALIVEQLHSDVALVENLGHYIVDSGGKRLRPMVVLLAAGAAGPVDQKAVSLAAVIEFIHTATLLHDDVVDGSLLRRGQKTANAQWGNEASVLVGDFIYSRAFEMMVAVGDMTVMDIMSHTTNAIAEGEVLQLVNCRNPETDETAYLEVIKRKTARLFEAGARLGGIAAGADETTVNALGSYGHHLGMAYQLVDDVLDFCGSTDEIGKNVGDDLAEGKPTLPIIQAMEQSDAETAGLLRQAIVDADSAKIDEVLATVKATGAIDYTAELARTELDKAIAAIAGLPDGEYKTALANLATFTGSRTY